MNIQGQQHGTEGHHANLNTKAQEDNGTCFSSLAVVEKVGVLKRDCKIVASRSYQGKKRKNRGIKKSVSKIQLEGISSSDL